MTEPLHDFGLVEAIAVDALGEPGSRTFRLMIRGEGRNGLLWLEKEQVQALAMATDELLAQIPAHEQDEAALGKTVESTFAATFDVEFKIGQLSMGYDEAGQYFLLLVHSVEDDFDQPPSFRCLISRGQLAVLGKQAHDVIAAGRPRCMLCGQPLEPAPHFCPPSNGHSTDAKVE